MRSVNYRSPVEPRVRTFAQHALVRVATVSMSLGMYVADLALALAFRIAPKGERNG